MDWFKIMPKPTFTTTKAEAPKIMESLPQADPKAVAEWQKAGAAAKTSAANLGSVLGNTVKNNTQAQAKATNTFLSKMWGFFK